MAKKPKVEVVIPIYNEEAELEGNITKLYNFLKTNLNNFEWNISIVDNASTDNSKEIGKNLEKRLKNISLFHLNEKGRGRAVKLSWKKSQADYLVYMDVDLSTDLNCLLPLLNSLSHGYDIAIGSRLLKKSHVKNRPLKREILSRCYNILIKSFFQVHFSDAQCGFKAVTKRVVKELVPHILDNAWFFDSELLIVGEKVGYKIFEVPVHWIDNPGSTVRVLHTVTGDLFGLLRLFFSRPWRDIKI